MKSMLQSLCLTSLFLVLIMGLTASPVTAETVNHSPYDQLLNEFVKGGYFDYASFAEDSEAQERLQQYLSSMSDVDTTDLSADGELAY